jgi:hypothetical protein
MTAVTHIMASSWLLAIWLAVSLLSCAVLVYDLRQHNSQIAPLMKLVWVLSVLYSGAIGLLIYYFAGRRQIPHDSLWRKGFRSVAHCYAGCGAGEIAGVVIAAGLFAMGNLGIGILSFALAYVFGYGLTVGPMLQNGAELKYALRDALYSDTATITVMEITAVSLDLWLGARAGITQVQFWNSLFLSLSAGLLAAYPVNVLLVKLGVKSGMGNPRSGDMQHTH